MSLRSVSLRLRIGVTGHRRLPDPKAVGRRIAGVLRGRIREWLSRSGEVPAVPFYTLLTSLAEGADCLAAEEVLRTRGGELEAVLPLPVEEYLKDFSTPESMARFRSLLERSGRVTVLGAGDREVREAAYEKAGRQVADHADLLIAVWDGRPARGRGGTAEIVAYARRRRIPLAILPADGQGEIRFEPGRGLAPARETGAG